VEELEAQVAEVKVAQTAADGLYRDKLKTDAEKAKLVQEW
jgi:hypothetical protein